LTYRSMIVFLYLANRHFPGFISIALPHQPRPTPLLCMASGILQRPLPALFVFMFNLTAIDNL